MNQYSSVFHLISEISRKEGISCILIGGYAVNYHKVTRQTGDVDFMITKEDFERISAVLKEAGYEQASFQDNFAQFKSRQPSFMDIDFMFVDKNTYDKIFQKAARLKVRGWEFFLPCLDHLIALKLHSLKCNYHVRWTKDLPDIISLIRANKVDAQTAEFKELCLKFGTEEIYQKIKEAADGRP